MGSKLPLISIVIPAYNVGEYLGKCLESVVSQTYRNLDIVVVNDGSSDGSAALIKDFAAREGRINLVDKQNEGVVLARRDGIGAAKGEFVFFLDGDDYISLDCVEKLYDAIKDDCAVACCALIRVREGYSSPLPRNTTDRAEGLGFLKHLLLHDIFAGVAGMMYRRALLQDLHHYPEIRLWEDFLMNIQIAMHPGVKCVRFLDDAFYYYVQRPGSGNHARDSFEYIMHFSELVGQALESDPQVESACRDEILIDRIHWYHIYIKKSRNPWVGNTDFAKRLYEDIRSNRKRLKGRVPAATLATIRLYRYRMLRPLVVAISTVRRFKQSADRRRRK